MNTTSLILGFCLFAKLAVAEESIAKFAKQTLGLNLASISFGAAQTNGGFGKAEAPHSLHPMVADATVSWMTNSSSAKYRSEFQNRTLKYGFRDGQLVVMRVSIDTISAMTSTHSTIITNTSANTPDPNTNSTSFMRLREDLVRIQNELLKTSPNEKKLSFEDDKFRIQYAAMCSPHPDSLFMAEIQISPHAGKASK